MELRNANGNVPVDIVRRDRDRYAISFMPLIEGINQSNNLSQYLNSRATILSRLNSYS